MCFGCFGREKTPCLITQYIEYSCWVLLLDEWMTCDFMSFSTVFQSYQDNGRLIMNGCVQWNSIYGCEDLPQAGIKLGRLYQLLLEGTRSSLINKHSWPQVNSLCRKSLPKQSCPNIYSQYCNYGKTTLEKTTI